MAIEILKNAWLEKGKTIFLFHDMSPPIIAFPPWGGMGGYDELLHLYYLKNNRSRYECQF